MKLISAFVAVSLITSNAVSFALSDEEAVIQGDSAEDSAGSLVKRQCDSDTSCKGYGWSSDLHCGDGYYGCVKGNVYQIGSDPTNVCSYGVRTTCQKCNKLVC